MQSIHTEIEEYIDSKKEFCELLLYYIENEDESPNYELRKKLLIYNKSLNVEDNISIFQIILSICNNHQRSRNFQTKIDNIFKYLTNTIKQTMTNSETFEFFKSNKMIIFYLIKNQIIQYNSKFEIGDSTFSGCSSLTQIIMHSFMTKIGKYAFFLVHH